MAVIERNQAVTELIVDGQQTSTALDEASRAWQRHAGVTEAMQAKINSGMSQQMRFATGLPQSVDSVTRAYQRLQASLDPVLKVQYAAQQEMRKQLDLTANAVRLGVENEVGAARTISQLRQRQIADIERVKQAQLSANAANQNVTSIRPGGSMNTANIAAQFQDIGVTAAMGMSPLQIALQQGTQLSAVLGPMGAAGAVRSLGTALLSIVNPVSLVTLGLVAAAAAAIQYFMNWKSSAADSEETLKAQNELISQVVGQWKGALPALTAYNEELKRNGNLQDAIAAGKAASQQQYAPIREQVPSLNVDIADAVDMLSRIASPEDISRVQALQSAFDSLAEKVKNSTGNGADALAVSKQLTDLLQTYGITTLGDYAGKFSELARQLDAVAQKSKKFSEETALILSPLDPLDGFNRTPFQKPIDMEVYRARRKREQDEKDAENRRLGAGVPTPTARPNLEDMPSPGADYLANQAKSIEMLKLEISLVGKSEEARKKQIAVLSAEQDIRRAGIDLHGEEANAIRAAALEQVDLSQKLTAMRTKEAQELQAQRHLQQSVFSALDDQMKKLIDGTFTWKDALGTALSLLLEVVKQALSVPGGNSWQGFLGNVGGMFGGDSNGLSPGVVTDPWVGLRGMNDNSAAGASGPTARQPLTSDAA